MISKQGLGNTIFDQYTEGTCRERVVTIKVTSVGPGGFRGTASARSIVIYFSFRI